MSGKVGKMVMPSILYGTAWKKERTCDLVVEAVRAGFRGIDTACQPNVFVVCRRIDANYTCARIITNLELEQHWYSWLSSAFNVKILFFKQNSLPSMAKILSGYLMYCIILFFST
jgi:hypothetical protein